MADKPFLVRWMSKPLVVIPNSLSEEGDMEILGQCVRSIRQTVASLSGGQRQSVAVARAVMWNSRLVILDEPTAALGVAQTRQVLELVKRLGQQGLAVVIISHNLHDVFEVADSITVLRLGQDVARFTTAQTNQTEVVAAITAGALTKVPGQQEVPA